MLVDRILRSEAGEREPLAKDRRFDLHAERDVQAGAAKRRAIDQSRHERTRGRDDERAVTGSQGIERTRAGRRDFEMWRQTAVRIDFL